MHVIDGLLDSSGQPLGQPSASAPTGANNRLPDIMDTLRQCDKFDGFVTLAEGTGLTQILKQGEYLFNLGGVCGCESLGDWATLEFVFQVGASIRSRWRWPAEESLRWWSGSKSVCELLA